MSDPLQQALRCLESGDPAGAAEYASHALDKASENAGAWHLRGFALLLSGNPADALQALDRAAEIDPARPDLHRHRADAHQADGRPAEAIALYRTALAHGDQAGDLFFNLARAQVALKDYVDAEKNFRRAASLNPDDAEALNGIGLACLALDRPADALPALEQALEINPGLTDAAIKRASALRQTGRLDAAAAGFRDVLSRVPDSHAAEVGLAECMIQGGDLAEAARHFQRAIDLQPDAADIRYQLGQVLMMTGNYAQGWPAFAHRFAAHGAYAAKRPFNPPQWDGSALEGRRLLLWGEQGVGDEILFGSMLPALANQRGRIVVECDSRFVPLFGRSFPAMEFVGRENPPAAELQETDFDFQCAVGDLGGFFRNGLSDFPAKGGFLRPDPALTAALHDRYRGLADGRRVIGISWRSKADRLGLVKSTRLVDWGPLLKRSDILFVDLQYGNTRSERDEATDAHGGSLLHDDTVDPLADLDAFAAQVGALDGVITTSNATAHFAGGLGVETQLLLQSNIWDLPWYWSQKVDRVPWYPSIRILRQEPAERWPSVVARASSALASH